MLPRAALVTFAAAAATTAPVAGAAAGPAPVSVADFGCIGDGKHDDTTCLQAAIDYAYAHDIQTILCGDGAYKTTDTVYLDPPGNLRAHWKAPTIFGFSMSFEGEDHGLGNVNGFGCRLRADFNDAPAFVIGPGQRMKVEGISVVSTVAGYRGNLPAAGVGIGIAGGNGGASETLIENTYVGNFYTLYKTDVNDACCLSDSNSFRKISGDNGYYGIYLWGTQTDINDVIEPRLSAAVAIDSEFSRPVTIFGGNLSAVSGRSAAFGLSSTSGFSKTRSGNAYDYSFDTVIAAPDIYIPNVYNSFAVVTNHFGVVPLTMDNWNPANRVATFRVYLPWAIANFGILDLASGTDLQREIAAAPAVYAAERVTVAKGMAISMVGQHIENPEACTTFLDLSAGWRGGTASEIRAPLFNYDPAFTRYAAANHPAPSNLALFYCQQAFPFIRQARGGETGKLLIDGGDFGQTAPDAPLLIEQSFYPIIQARGLSGLAALNERIPGLEVYNDVRFGDNQNEAPAAGAGEWDRDYFEPHGLTDSFHGIIGATINGPLLAPFWGFHPAAWASPDLSPDLFALVSGRLGRLGTYPPIDCQTVYKSIAWNSPELRYLWVRSASCPGWSWGQNLDDAAVGGTVNWSYKGQSAMLYLDGKTLLWIFPGLGLTLDNGSGARRYVVTGVYPQLGYATVIGFKNGTAQPQGAPLAGDKNRVYSCSSDCVIGQLPFSWKLY